MRLLYLSPDNFVMEVGRALEKLGHKPILLDPLNRQADAILVMSVTQMDRAWKALKLNPGAKIFVYDWDVYDWALATPRPGEYDYTAFGRLCEAATEVWAPSEAERGRYKRWTGRDAVVVTSAVPFWHLPEIEPTDDRFVLDTLRETPDPGWGMAAEVCRELGIPLKASKHAASFEEYCCLLATCTFTICTLREASTGGLGLVEANWYGKMALIPDNEENAALEYAIPGYARSFKAMSRDDLKRQIEALWRDSAPLAIEGVGPVRDEIRRRFAAEVMAGTIDARLRKHL
jgi:hypothetical protein